LGIEKPASSKNNNPGEEKLRQKVQKEPDGTLIPGKREAWNENAVTKNATGRKGIGSPLEELYRSIRKRKKTILAACAKKGGSKGAVPL